jgi:hypothetical protein
MLSFVGAHYDALVIVAMGAFTIVLLSISIFENLKVKS